MTQLMKTSVAIHWFRQDLRLNDNPSLIQATHHHRVLPIYILDDDHAGPHAMGEASRVWLHHALDSLHTSLKGNLSLYTGNPLSIFNKLQEHYIIEAVYWNRCYEPWRIARDQILKDTLKQQGVRVESFNGSLLWEPWSIQKNDGTPYQVFTPFYKNGCLKASPPRSPLLEPEYSNYVFDTHTAQSLESLNLLPHVRWDGPVVSHWSISEEDAHSRFTHFLNTGLSCYAHGRDRPDWNCVSKMSPYLHFGHVSPHQLWHAVRSGEDHDNQEPFCRELAWREFAYHQLYTHPTLPTHNLRRSFDDFPWHDDTTLLHAWQQGKTGIPMVDAGMRELWQTGYMHNRVRMIVGSFLVKNLRLHWHHGERWFWDTLFDADLANNSASWQWVAGCGIDAAPYFRIFNPITQGQKYDPDGTYIRRFIPEIAHLPNTYLFAPWTAPEPILKRYGIQLGHTYPKPIVDLDASRRTALDAFKQLRTL